MTKPSKKKPFSAERSRRRRFSALRKLIKKRSDIEVWHGSTHAARHLDRHEDNLTLREREVQHYLAVLLPAMVERGMINVQLITSMLDASRGNSALEGKVMREGVRLVKGGRLVPATHLACELLDSARGDTEMVRREAGFVKEMVEVCERSLPPRIASKGGDPDANIRFGEAMVDAMGLPLAKRDSLVCSAFFLSAAGGRDSRRTMVAYGRGAAFLSNSQFNGPLENVRRDVIRAFPNPLDPHRRHYEGIVTEAFRILQALKENPKSVPGFVTAVAMKKRALVAE